MGMTMTQKILAAHAHQDSVQTGQLIEADLDLVLGNDITAPVAIKEMDKFSNKGVFDKDKIALVPDHFVPAKDIKSAENCKCVREFARKNKITNYFEVGQMGIEPIIRALEARPGRLRAVPTRASKAKRVGTRTTFIFVAQQISGNGFRWRFGKWVMN